MPYDPSIELHLRRLYAADRRAFAFDPARHGDGAAWRAAARPELRRLLGLDRMRDEAGGFRPSVALNAPEELDGYTRTRGVLHAEPEFRVPFWHLRPPGPGPFPVALFPHGHYRQHGMDYAVGLAATDETREKIAREDRDVAVQAVRRGFAAIAPATRGFAPAVVPDVTARHGTSDCRSHAVHALLAGRTAVGERVWDLERLLDWALAQPDVDPSTVLIMGNSGGGVASLYAAACDPRITIAVASCSFCTFVGGDGAVRHCDCNLVPGMLRFGDFPDVAGLIAPRALLVVHGREDALFPPEDTERAVAALRRIYGAAGAAARFRHAFGAGGHRFYADLMWPFVEDARGARRKPI